MALVRVCRECGKRNPPVGLRCAQCGEFLGGTDLTDADGKPPKCMLWGGIGGLLVGMLLHSFVYAEGTKLPDVDGWLPMIDSRWHAFGFVAMLFFAWSTWRWARGGSIRPPGKTTYDDQHGESYSGPTSRFMIRAVPLYPLMVLLVAGFWPLFGSLAALVATPTSLLARAMESVLDWDTVNEVMFFLHPVLGGAIGVALGKSLPLLDE